YYNLDQGILPSVRPHARTKPLLQRLDTLVADLVEAQLQRCQAGQVGRGGQGQRRLGPELVPEQVQDPQPGQVRGGRQRLRPCVADGIAHQLDAGQASQGGGGQGGGPGRADPTTSQGEQPQPGQVRGGRQRLDPLVADRVARQVER